MLRADTVSEDFGLNDLAALHNGGGHATAAAFQLKDDETADDIFLPPES